MIRVPEKPVLIRPVGVVVSEFKECSRKYNYNNESMIYMREDLSEALCGLEFFSHLHVIYYQHQRRDWLKLIGWQGTGLPLTIPSASESVDMGIYTSRSPSRPSAMGSCVVEIIKREENRIYVKGLDALDGSPVLDIKIYVPRYDSIPEAETPLNCCMGNELATTSRNLHWDNMNVALALGLRIGTKAMQALGIARGEAARAEVAGEHFFAQGIEGATGCSVVHNTMIFDEIHTSTGQWRLKLVCKNGEVEIRLRDHVYSGAGEVLKLEDDVLFD